MRRSRARYGCGVQFTAACLLGILGMAVYFYGTWAGAW